MLTGLHLAHVVVGLAVLGFLFTRSRHAEQPGRAGALIEGAACW